MKEIAMLFFLGFFTNLDAQPLGFILESASFYHNTLIPIEYTCDGKNISPELHWSNAPAGTKSFVLIVDDPDAPTKEPFVHWVLFNIPAAITCLEENVQAGDFISGATSFDKTESVHKYGGPCPPSGTHRYFFKLYALDTELALSQGATKEDVLLAMKNNILGQAELIGLYKCEKNTL